MKRSIFVMVALLMVLSAIPAFANQGNMLDVNGPHYNLNIIGVPQEKTADMTNTNGHTLFVKEYGKTTINLCESGVGTDCKDVADFAVLDRNGTDGKAAFALPNPATEVAGTTAYRVYVRALGKPGGKAQMQSCYTDAQGATWCAVDYVGGVEPIVIDRDIKGFINVTKDLLYVDYCLAQTQDITTGEWTCTSWDQLPLFSDKTADYFWEYDNSGLKLAQFRFYPIPYVTGW